MDIRPQKRYPFEFHQGDWRDFVNDDKFRKQFQVFHASPPCQKYSIANNIHGTSKHPDLVEQVKAWLDLLAPAWVIENVPGAPLPDAVVVCGLSFGLNVKRHRLFQSNFSLVGSGCGDHSASYVSVFGHGAQGRMIASSSGLNGCVRRYHPFVPHATAAVAMGIDWMTRDELSQAIPPAYTKFIGDQLMRILENAKP